MIENLLSKLEKVRSKGRGKWVACCPAHADKSPSLAITEIQDGTILIHCFGKCSITEITDAIGLSVADLFPKSDDVSVNGRGLKRPFSTSQILPAFERELLVGVQFLGAIGRGATIPEIEKKRAAQCAERLAKLAGLLS
jgi:CHC2 zinc finger